MTIKLPPSEKPIGYLVIELEHNELLQAKLHETRGKAMDLAIEIGKEICDWSDVKIEEELDMTGKFVVGAQCVHITPLFKEAKT